MILHKILINTIFKKSKFIPDLPQIFYLALVLLLLQPHLFGDQNGCEA